MSQHGRAGAVLTAVGVVVTIGAGPAAAEPAFGAAPVAGPARAGGGPVSVRAVDVGRHAGYDRVVFRAANGLPSWQVRYVSQLTHDGSGKPVPLEGTAVVQLVFQGTAWTEVPSVQPALDPRLPALRQVRGAGEFEGTLTFGLGQATRAGFRAYALTGPDRLVVDVAHPAGTSPAPVPPAATSRAATSPAPTERPAATPTGAAPTAATPTGATSTGATPTGAAEPVTDTPATDTAAFDDLDDGTDLTLPLVLGGAVLAAAAVLIFATVRARRR